MSVTKQLMLGTFSSSGTCNIEWWVTICYLPNIDPNASQAALQFNMLIPKVKWGADMFFQMSKSDTGKHWQLATQQQTQAWS